MNNKKSKSSGFAPIKNSRQKQSQISDSPEPKPISKNSSSTLNTLVGTIHNCRIVNMAVGGAGVARIQHLEKSVTVFVSSAALGDELKVKIDRAEKNYLTAEIVEVVKSSLDRNPAKCIYFADCGGCNWQHIKYESQILYKELLLKDLFQKYLPQVKYHLSPTVSSPRPYHYRNRIQLKYLNGQLGYFKRRSNEIVPIERCEIADEKINSEISRVKSSLRPKSEVQKVELKMNINGQFEFYPIGSTGEGLSFSQVNSSVNDLLVEKTVLDIQKISPTHLTELYCGAGNFTLPILKNNLNLQIDSIEFNAELTESLKKSSQDLKLQRRLTVFTGTCENFVTRRSISDEVVLLDPPRDGCQPVVIQKISLARPKHIIYISCNPASLVRDLDSLIKNQPSYKIEEIQIFDMFPQTDHFETYVKLIYQD